MQLKNLKIFLPDRIVDNGVIVIEGTKIKTVGENLEGPEDGSIELDGFIAVPGYIDTHCHGAVNHDCNDGTMEAIEHMNAFYQQHGITSYYPSLSIDPMPKLLQAFVAVRAAMNKNQPGNIEVLGTHFESPFINVIYKGAQLGERVLDLTEDHFRTIEANKDIIKRITIAPELHMPYVKRLADLGIIVSGGHSNALKQDMVQATGEGMRMITHLCNAMSSVKKNGPFRVTGMLESALTMDELFTEVIVDRYHVPDEMVQIAYRCKGVDKLFLCSDANRAAGMKTGESIFTCGQEVIVENGAAMLKDRSSLASSVTPMDKMVRNLIEFVGIPPIDAIKMASTTVARAMKIDDRKGSIEAGKDADINILDPNFNVVMSFFRGKVGFMAEEMKRLQVQS
jgi:N-acetylglucosamine-6-phosphate deacetylase